MNMPVSFTRKSVSFLALLFCSMHVFAADKTDTLKQKTNLTINNIDSLKRQLDYSNDSLKGQIYTRIAMQYMRYDTISNKKTRTEYQEAALKNTMSALHYFSRLNDSTGLRMCFDRLATVYHAQKKYAQAKWFILQSNSISRIKNDIPNIITSLVELASVKKDIKDYSLAMRDLNEALQLSTLNHFARQESQVQLGFAMLYTRMDNPAKSANALKRHLAIDDSVKKAEEKALTARIKTADSIEEAKKKAYMIGSKVLCGPGSSSRQVSSQSLSYSLLSSR
jgi:hypothetical protein